ncbi:MAG: hypothetical protein B7Z77_05175, partial [Acidocella sp. 20-58-15]
FRGRDTADSFTQGTTSASGGRITGFSRGALGQRELPLFGVVGGRDQHSVKPRFEQNGRNIAHLDRPTPALVIPKTEAEVDFNGDLTWIGKIRRPLTNKLVVWVCGMLMMGGLTYREAAKRVGMTQSAFRTFRTRSSIPVDEDRRKFGDIFDEQGARETLAQAGYVLRHCMTASENSDGRGNWFWVHKKDVGKIRLSPPKRKRIHQIEGRYNKISILTGTAAKLVPGELMMPFAKAADRNGCNRNSWSAAHA